MPDKLHALKLEAYGMQKRLDRWPGQVILDKSITEAIRYLAVICVIKFKELIYNFKTNPAKTILVDSLHTMSRSLDPERTISASTAQVSLAKKGQSSLFPAKFSRQPNQI
jgi:hypothetical protein